jgi:hypothetical protein
VDEVFGRADAFLFGRRTYEHVTHTGEDGPIRYEAICASK